MDSDSEPPESVPNSVTQLTLNGYNAISASDNSRYTSPDPGNGDEASLKCDFIISEKPSSVTKIGVLWEGYPAVAYDVTIWFWNINTKAWDAKATLRCLTSDTNIAATITTGISNYINANGHFIFCVQNRDDSDRLITDFLKLEIMV
ncbi:MAG: hypothetical protein V1850_06005 [Candidatus Bathyarchaeota archaeon]